MLKGYNFIGFERSGQSTQTIKVYSTLEQRYLNDTFYPATDAEIELAVQKAKSAFTALKEISNEQRAAFLEAIAAEIEANAEENISKALVETALPKGRLEGETGRTTGQLRFFAKIVREGSYQNCIIDLAQPERSPLPKPGLRTINVPLGPVVVFAASNFPFAFSTAGGDTASALAAGCPVIVKAHPAHLGTNELISACILRAAEKCNMPNGVFSSLNGEGAELGAKLAAHPGIKAIGFTGSRNAGLALSKIASEREVPIPVYAEMSSVNPVVILPELLAEKAEETAGKLAASISLGAGQFCTNPGLLFVLNDKNWDVFAQTLQQKLSDTAGQVMLNRGIAQHYYESKDKLRQSKSSETLLFAADEQESFKAAPGIFKVSLDDFLADKHLQNEVFGPTSIMVVCNSKSDLLDGLESLEGQLTATVFGTASELQNYRDLVAVLTEKAGRIIFNSAPTGVEVSYAMVHGGPFPATSDARSTSVGGAAINRFLRPVCFQDFPDDILPEGLKNENKQRILRKVDGIYNTKDI
ncbi:aldehyde dehydrogenase (NADP(+)) [Pedobacter frigoris]|uniref:Aldehyde dehydrogenase (NADP(+)) n=1 Tax=Pedobacter frigoris TaxID=2571272 RepID=A0A4U1CNX1_9SPHI|nr:aldehyde dehydrogenase (NADP(+)) [Pedobacter frigoris]TKC08956.1 aldehyde dehydrogenase (NADP(+)) [Pedobacter frigoris]